MCGPKTSAEGYPNPDDWFIVDYAIDDEVEWLGLKVGDGIVRGVPEGTRRDWAELLEDIEAGMACTGGWRGLRSAASTPRATAMITCASGWTARSSCR